MLSALRNIAFFKKQTPIFSVVTKSLESKELPGIRARSGFKSLSRFGSMWS